MEFWVPRLLRVKPAQELVQSDSNTADDCKKAITALLQGSPRYKYWKMCLEELKEVSESQVSDLTTLRDLCQQATMYVLMFSAETQLCSSEAVRGIIVRCLRSKELQITPNSKFQNATTFIRREIASQTVALDFLLRALEFKTSLWRGNKSCTEPTDAASVCLLCIFGLLQDLALMLSGEMQKFTGEGLLFNGTAVSQTVEHYRYWDQSLIDFALAASDCEEPVIPDSRPNLAKAERRLQAIVREDQRLPDKHAEDYKNRAYPVQALASRRIEFNKLFVSMRFSLQRLRHNYRDLHGSYKKEVKRGQCNPVFIVYDMLQRLNNISKRLQGQASIPPGLFIIGVDTVCLARDYLRHSTIHAPKDAMHFEDATNLVLDRLRKLSVVD